MGYLTLHCHTCGGSWAVYLHNRTDPNSRHCPHCFREVSEQTWQGWISKGFGWMEEANMELYKDHTGHPDVGAFSVEYRHRNTYKERKTED